jgi:hypothetical protein
MKSFKAHLEEACWKGYKAVGVKDKGGRKVPNCVPVSEQPTGTESKLTHKRGHQISKHMHSLKAIPSIKTEEVDKKDTITFDIPLLIRVLELTREEIKTDADLHRVVERLIDIRNKGVLTMDDYDRIAK